MRRPGDPPPAPQAGFRLEPRRDPAAVGEDPWLAAAIREEIRSSGPITFARFMARALYEPGHGYYRRAEAGPGRAGDFLTSPEAHPLFGAAIGRLLEQAWEAMGRPDPFVVTEPGAGTGSLAAGMLTGLRDLRSPLLAAVRYRPVELEPARLAALRDRLAEAGLAGELIAGAAPGSPAGPAASPAAATETGAVVANEVLDALPVHRVIGRPAGLRELLVDVAPDGRLVEVEAPPTTDALAGRLASEGVRLADGQVTEVCLAVDAWLADAVRHLGRGIVVLVDYADEPAALHGPGRPGGTLRAFARHALAEDPLAHVGRQDLTATVDLAAVRAAARAAGLLPVGETSQAELLAHLGTPELVRSYLERPGATLEDGLLLRSALARLLDPRGMGAFRVLAFTRGLPPPPPGGPWLPALAPLGRPARTGPGGRGHC